MLKTLTTIPVGLIFLICQAPLFADTDVREEAVTDAMASSSVPDSQYQRLQAQLQRHRKLAEAGGWPEVPDGPTIRPGAEDPRLATLARRLAVSGDLADDGTAVSTSEYNATLQDAVRRFQARHGLEVDALVGRATLRALNVLIQRRIEQIRLNLERARQRIDIQGNDLILVNVAAFKAYVVHDGNTVWTTKVIAGEKENETPEFRSTLKYVVFNPTWTVPHSIARKEMLPKIKADPGFFDKGRYELFDRAGDLIDPSSVDWSTVGIGSFPFTLVQQPGPKNELGQIKFMFPNEYSVCMHDTPGKSLFNKAARAFSHGCIRVDEPLGFAEVILGKEGWSREQIDSQVESKETRTVVLSNPLPVFVLYWTVEVDDSGMIYFYDDIYERDARLLKSLD